MTVVNVDLDDRRARYFGAGPLLGLCPLLAVSTSLGRGVGLGLATLLVLATSNVLAALVGRWLPAEIRIAAYVLVIASLVTCVEFTLAASLPRLHLALGIFLPLIASNCMLLARVGTSAAQRPLPAALLDGLTLGGGFLLAIAGLGALRELLGRGSIGHDVASLFGAAGDTGGLQFFGADHGWPLVLLSPGAFILLGLVLALRQWRRSRASHSTATADSAAAPQAGSA